MEDLCEFGLELLQSDASVSYADVKYMRSDIENINVKNNILETLSQRTKHGIGFRVICNNAWGYASTDQITKEKIQETVQMAIRTAKASASIGRTKLELADEPIYEDKVTTKFERDPFNVSTEEKLEILLPTSSRGLEYDPRIKFSSSYYSARKDNVILFTSEGTKIDQTIVYTGGGVSVLAADQGEVQIRSLPASFRGDFATSGYEYFEELNILNAVNQAAEEACGLLSAPQCPNEKATIIIGPSQMQLQIHESTGHPTELDRVLDYEAAFAGTSFLKPKLLQAKFMYGNDLITLIADANEPRGLGSYFYDHEGVKAQKITLVDKGEFGGYMSSRETAAEICLERSSGSMRAMGPQHIPLVRMTNVNLMPGDWELDELIADTKEGYFIDSNSSWSIDSLRLSFQFGCEIAWKIENGELSHIVKNPSYTGITPQFWNSCTGIANKKHWRMFGTPNCGKGEPGQLAYVGHGSSPTRFENVHIGIVRGK